MGKVALCHIIKDEICSYSNTGELYMSVSIYSQSNWITQKKAQAAFEGIHRLNSPTHLSRPCLEGVYMAFLDPRHRRYHRWP